MEESVYDHTYADPERPEDRTTARKTNAIGNDVLGQAKGATQNAPKYLLYDGHGSTRQLVNNTGASVLKDYSYDAYGVMLGGNPGSPSNPDAPATNLLYAGEQFDIDAQQYYLRARYYDPLNGRFNRTDPFAGNHSDPQSLHRYLYCHANPVNNVDPSGRFSLTETLTVNKIVAISIGALAPAIITAYETARTLIAHLVPVEIDDAGKNV